MSSALLEIAEGDQPDDQRKLIQRLARRRTTNKTARKARMVERMPTAEQTRYEELLSSWEASPKFREGWRRATKEHRGRFINEVLRGTSGYDLDEAAALVKSAFCGRKNILVQDLLRLGEKHGFHKKVIRTVVRHLGYRKKRLDWNRHHPWSYINTDRFWKDKVKLISSKEFEDRSPPKPREELPDVDYGDDDKDEVYDPRALDKELDQLFPDDARLFEIT